MLTEDTLITGLDEAAHHCAHVAAALAEVGYPTLRQRPQGFATLLRAIVGQQVSVASADAIWRRVEAGVRPMAPEALLKLDDNAMRGLGLSRPKITYARALSDECVSGGLDLAALEDLDDDSAREELVAVKGIGRWTAEVYLLFALGRRDVLPADDLALLVAAQRLFGWDERPKQAALTERAEVWRPWRGAVAHLLWRYYSAGANRSGDASLPV